MKRDMMWALIIEYVAMHAWEAIEQSLVFIEEKLTKEISTEKLASTAGLSPLYFQRLFKRLVNKPVQEYVKLRRLAKAVDLDFAVFRFVKNPLRNCLDLDGIIRTIKGNSFEIYRKEM